MIYNIQMRLDHLLDLPEAKEILDQIIPGVSKIADASPQALALSIEQVVRYARIPEGEEKLIRLDEELKKLNTPENAISPKEAVLIKNFQEIAETDAKSAQLPATHHQDAIYPGQPWLDTQGKRIQAHGGAVIYEKGTYYWYGENKGHTDGKNGVWTWGIRVYSSKDLCNWEDRGFLIPPNLDDPNSSMFPTRYVDRPHLIYCPNTGKYVCWIKLSGSEAAFTVWQADALLGPYVQVENMYRPGGYCIGDFDLISDSETGKGYIYMEVGHNCLLGMELSEDYLHADREVAKSYPDRNPPFTREGPAVFEAHGRKWMYSSGMTGYVPNKSDLASAVNWTDVFESLGNPHIDDESHASFNSQICKVFRIETPEADDRFVVMADRWLPDYPVDARRADVFTRAVASNYDPEHYQATDEEKQEMLEGNVLETANISVADYVWLPVEWVDGKPMIRWHEAWTPKL